MQKNWLNFTLKHNFSCRVCNRTYVYPNTALKCRGSICYLFKATYPENIFFNICPLIVKRLDNPQPPS